MAHARNRRAAAVTGLLLAAAAPAAHSATCPATGHATLPDCITGAGDTIQFGADVTLTGFLKATLRTFLAIFAAAGVLLEAAATPFAVTARSANEVGIVDVGINLTVARVSGFSFAAGGIAVLPGSSHFYVGDYSGNRVRVIDATDYQVVATIPLAGSPSAVTLNPAGTRLYTSIYASNSVVVIDTTTNLVLTTVPVGAGPSGVSVSPSGNQAYVANTSGGTVSVIDTASNTVTNTITVGTSPYAVAFSPDGSRAFVANYFTDNISVIDTAAGTVTATWASCDGPSNLDVDAGGTALYASCSNGTAAAHDASTGAIVAGSAFPIGRGYAVQADPAGGRVFFAGTVAFHTTDTSLAALQVTGAILNAHFSSNRFISTRADDTVPQAYSFAPQTGTALATPITSAPAFITKVNTRASVTVSGAGAYCVSSTNACTCDVRAFATTAGTILPNQYLCVQHTSSAAPLTQTDTTVTVGGVSATFSSTTAAVVPGAPAIGTATGGDAQISVTFTAPASDGGSAILDYTATCGSQSATGAGSPLVVTGVANGTPYTCTVVARNAVGTSAPSAASNSVTPATIPGAPVIGTATSGNTQVSVAFTAPASDGGSAILDYTATCGSQSTTGAGSPLVVTGLTNGTPYTCTVTARNAVGTGAPSAASNSVTPATIPGAPVIGTATPGNTQVSVAFTAPASDGGSAILDYTATCGSQSATGAASPITVSGLVNGTPYTCTVVARNAVGTGPASAPSNSATPLSVPFAPTGVIATAGNAQISVAFTPGANGGSPILDFTATCGAQSTTGAGSPLVVTGLTNGTPYTCTVTARNVAGSSAPSTASNSATPVTVPGAPTGVIATAGNAQISVAFTAPASTGGSAILDYTATCGSQSTTGAASPLVVAGLVNGTAYTCTVTARNAVGTGPASAASNSATPTVNTYSGPSATGSGTITASFTGGGPTCTYTVSRFIPVTGDPASPPTTPPAGTTFPHGLFDFTTAGCTPGSTITMAITYPQALLTGTQYWKYGPTPMNPAPHWYVLPATITSNTVTFTITDGQLGDDDLAANGTIVDQGGPGTPGSAVAVPTLSEWAMLLLASLVMLAGMGAVRRR